MFSSIDGIVQSLLQGIWSKLFLLHAYLIFFYFFNINVGLGKGRE